MLWLSLALSAFCILAPLVGVGWYPNCGFTLHFLMTNELVGFFMCLLGPFFEDARQSPDLILGSWEASHSPENTLISFPQERRMCHFLPSSLAQTHRRDLGSLCRSLSPQALTVHCSGPLNIPVQPGWAGLQFKGWVMESLPGVPC